MIRLMPELGTMTSLRSCLAILVLLSSPVFAQPKSATSPAAAESRTERYMQSVRGNVPLLTEFLEEMPKGADLHYHLSGGIYAETMIGWAADAKLCVVTQTLQLVKPPCNEGAGNVPAETALGNPVLYRQMVDAWSMRNWQEGHQSGHDHFFDTFDKFGLANDEHTGDMLADAAQRAALNHELYQELMLTADGGRVAAVGKQVGWIEDFKTMRETLLANGLLDAVQATRKNIAEAEQQRDIDLQCSAAKPEPACKITQRFLYQVLRGLPKQVVFAQILAGFEMASRDPHIVGFNLVMPEDYYVPMHDYDLHMQIIDFLKPLYPKVHISLHAGELAPGLVPPRGLTFHIREAVEKGHAERIGHGVTVMEEDNALELVKEMASRNVMVEINLTSNDVILGIHGKDHPLATYMKYGVPVALSTDDEGVSRSDLSMEYLRGATDQSLTYGQLKAMARTSLEHAFVAGDSLWRDPHFLRVKPCALDRPTTEKLSPACEEYLRGSEKATLQWELEKQFVAFESKW
jgi:adenosine deaminase